MIHCGVSLLQGFFVIYFQPYFNVYSTEHNHTYNNKEVIDDLGNIKHKLTFIKRFICWYISICL